MDALIAVCGLACHECPAYIATQKNDLTAKQKIARDWKKEFGMDIAPEQINCDGCRAESGRQIGHCGVCEIRLCGLAKGVANCAGCVDYGCEKLERFLTRAPKLRKNLETLRQASPRE